MTGRAPTLTAGRALRALAVVIALLGAVDPAITSSRRSRPVVSVVAAEPGRDSALAARVARVLTAGFAVIPAPFPRAEATVLVGEALPRARSALAAPVFAVYAGGEGPSVTIAGIDVPQRAPLTSRVPVTATVRTEAAAGRVLDVTLSAGGVIVDRASHRLAAAAERVRLSLAFVPSSAGVERLSVTARLAADGGRRGAADSADASTEVRDRRWPVLFYEARPSWMATFVRRVLERDTRFLVTSRTVTSRDVGRDAGRPPHRLDDQQLLEAFDAIVVGAPESLSERDVAVLETFMRRRGGAVVLLLDRLEPGPWERLANAGAWSSTIAAAPLGIAPAGDGVALRATEVAWPSRLPAGAEPLAMTARTPGSGARPTPVVWRSAVGAGRLVVSGALDAWRYRDPATSGFGRFWESLVADAADASPPAVSVALSPSVATPGTPVDVRVLLRDAALQDVRVALGAGRSVRTGVEARLEPAGVRARLDRAEGSARPAGVARGGGGAVVRLWPAAAIGRFAAVLRAPAERGAYRVVVVADGRESEAMLIVSGTARAPTPGHPQLLAQWTAALGGRAISAAALEELPAALRAALRPSPQSERWHPMRSAWWLLPFAFALSGEWWMRRRRGLA